MSVGITISASVFFTFFFTSFIQNTNASNIDCGKLTKYSTSEDQIKYYECLFHINGTLTYHSYDCPEGTCFDQIDEVCTSRACKSHNNSSNPPNPHVQTKNINVWVNSEKSETESRPLFGRAFSNRTDFVLGNKDDENNNFEITTTPEPLWVPSSIYYNCTGRRYNCSGPGLFVDPKDNTIFYKCRWSTRKNKWRAVCFQCNERFIKCFSQRYNACVPCDDVDSRKLSITDIISASTSYDCVGYTVFPCSQLGDGLHEHPGDKSIAVSCSNETFSVDGDWMGGCMTCNRSQMSCFIEGIQQCVENCTEGALHPYDCSHYKLKDKPCKLEGKYATPFDNTTYFQCVEAKDGSGKMMPECQPCPVQSYFNAKEQECIREEGATEAPPPILDARGMMDSVVDKKDMYEVVTTSAPPRKQLAAPPPPPKASSLDHVQPGGYTCRPYNDLLFPCREPGYFAHPEDTSIYFGCVPLPSGGFSAVCYTCNSVFETCFDDRQKACVTLGNNGTCSTSINLRNRTDKGNPGSSRTYSCVGYGKGSFPCRSFHTEGYYAMPGDLSVYVHCEDTNEDDIPEFESCHTCDKTTSGCFNINLNKCVNYCDTGSPNFTVHPTPPWPPVKQPMMASHRKFDRRPPDVAHYRWSRTWPYQRKVLTMPILSYDCSMVSFICTTPGLFVNRHDPSVWFECYAGRRINDWSIKCRVCPFHTCFDIRVRACVTSCRRIRDNWRFDNCRDHWRPYCDILGIG